MKIKQLVFVVNVLLIVTLIGGCGAQLPTKENVTTTTVSTEDIMTTDVPLAGESTADCIRTTPVGWTTPTTNSTQSTQTAATSTSGSTASSAPTTTTTIAAPTVHSLTPLATSSYYGLSKLKSMSNVTALVETYEMIVQAVQNCQTTIDMDVELSESEFLTVFYYYRADYPQHFWCDGSLRYAISQRSNKVVQFKLQYTMTGDELQQAQAEFYNVVVSLLELAATGNDEYERELLLHDALVKRTTYQECENAHNAYGALVNGKAVCEGYARAFQYLLYQSGIQCLIAEGNSINPYTGSSEGHAWNVVQIDGWYYHVDPTWDDTDDANIPVVYPYLNLTTAQISEDHTINMTNGYPLPDCTATAANYHVKNGTRLTIYTVDIVATILRENPDDTHVYCVNGGEAFVEWFNSNYRAVLWTMGIHRAYPYSISYMGNEVVIRLMLT